jgi:hypothetical protein
MAVRKALTWLQVHSRALTVSRVHRFRDDKEDILELNRFETEQVRGLRTFNADKNICVCVCVFVCVRVCVFVFVCVLLFMFACSVESLESELNRFETEQVRGLHTFNTHIWF